MRIENRVHLLKIKACLCIHLRAIKNDSDEDMKQLQISKQNYTTSALQYSTLNTQIFFSFYHYLHTQQAQGQNSTVSVDNKP